MQLNKTFAACLVIVGSLLFALFIGNPLAGHWQADRPRFQLSAITAPPRSPIDSTQPDKVRSETLQVLSASTGTGSDVVTYIDDLAMRGIFIAEDLRSLTISTDERPNASHAYSTWEAVASTSFDIILADGRGFDEFFCLGELETQTTSSRNGLWTTPLGPFEPDGPPYRREA